MFVQDIFQLPDVEVVERECGKNNSAFQRKNATKSGERRISETNTRHQVTPCEIQSPFYCFEMLKTSHNISEQQITTECHQMELIRFILIKLLLLLT